MRTLKLYATGSATGNGVASLVIPSSTTIRGLQFAVRINSITDGAQLDIEVSRSSSREIGTLGAQQSLVEVAIESNFVTSGLAQYGINQFFPVSIPMAQGQILYMHALVAGTVTYTATVIVHYG